MVPSLAARWGRLLSSNRTSRPAVRSTFRPMLGDAILLAAG